MLKKYSQPNNINFCLRIFFKCLQEHHILYFVLNRVFCYLSHTIFATMDLYFFTFYMELVTNLNGAKVTFYVSHRGSKKNNWRKSSIVLLLIRFSNQVSVKIQQVVIQITWGTKYHNSVPCITRVTKIHDSDGCNVNYLMAEYLWMIGRISICVQKSKGSASEYTYTCIGANAKGFM